MPFYQLLCLTAHYPEYKHIKDLVRQSALHVFKTGGVVQRIEYSGTQALPQRMRRHSAWHYNADYWSLYFVTSPQSVRELDRTMRNDPRVIKWSMIRLGHRVEDMVDTGSKTMRKDPEQDLLAKSDLQRWASAKVMQNRDDAV